MGSPVPGVPRRMPEHGRECNAITPTRGTVRRIGAPRGRTSVPRPGRSPARSGRGRRRRGGLRDDPAGQDAGAPDSQRTPRRRTTVADCGAPWRARCAGRPPERSFSANLARYHRCWGPHRLTPPPPAVLRCTSTPDDASGVRRGSCEARRTSQRAPRVKRFVIECFTPRCLVDLASDAEVVTNVPPDTVDLIMRRLRPKDGGARAGPRARRVDTRGARAP